MRLIGHIEVETIEEPDSLEFTIARQNGLIDIVMAPVVLIGFGVWACLTRHWWLILFPIIAAVYMIVRRASGNISRLSANRWKLTITADVEKYPDRQTVIATHFIESLGYSLGPSEDSSPGLYLNETCILEGLDREQAEEITKRIFQKFPEIGTTDNSRTSLLHGEDSGITTLGLSSRPPKP